MSKVKGVEPKSNTSNKGSAVVTHPVTPPPPPRPTQKPSAPAPKPKK